MRSLKTPSTLLLTLVIIFISSLQVLGGYIASAQPMGCGERGGIMIQAIGSDPPHLNPAISTGAAVVAASAGIFESLLRWDDSLNPYPALAESWNISTDGRIYVFYLVRNATWHDGTPFTAYDVKFTFEEILRKYHPRASLALRTLDRVDIIDNYTIQFVFKQPNPAFFYILNVLNAPILPRHLLEGYVTNITTAPFNTKPIGTGPFKFVEWKKGEYIKVERYENYYRKGYPCLDAIITKIYRDPLTAVLALEKGEVHYIPGYFLPYSESRRLISSKDIVVTDKGGALLSPMLYMMLNTRIEPLNDINFRKAIAYAINKSEIIDKVLFGFGKIATGPIPSTHWAYTSDVAIYDYNPDKAREILDKLGYRDIDGDGYREYPNGTKLTLVLAYNAASVIIERTANLVQEMLRRVGLRIEIRPYDEATILGVVYRDHRFHITFERLFTAPDPAIAVARLYHSSFANTAIPYTNSAEGYVNPKVDEMLDLASITFDQGMRKKIYAEFQRIVSSELPIIPLAEAPDVSAFRREVRNLHAWSAESRVERIDIWIQRQQLTQAPQQVETVKTQVTISPTTGMAAATSLTATPTPQRGYLEIALIIIPIVLIVTIATIIFTKRKR
jgi:peptide/nickel transport system substrate-binding protein